MIDKGAFPSPLRSAGGYEVEIHPKAEDYLGGKLHPRAKARPRGTLHPRANACPRGKLT